MKRNAIYWRTPNGEIGWNAPDEYHSKEEILTRIKERGWTLATKKDYIQSIYNRVYPKIKKALDENNLDEALSFVRWNGNDISMRAFGDITGVKLSPVMKVRLVQLKEYFGEKWDAWEQEKRAAAQERANQRKADAEAKHKAEVEEAVRKWNANEWVNGEQFQLLCALHGIELHIRTKGYCNKRLRNVRKDGKYMHAKGAECEGFIRAFNALCDKTETIAAA